MMELNFIESLKDLWFKVGTQQGLVEEDNQSMVVLLFLMSFTLD